MPSRKNNLFFHWPPVDLNKSRFSLVLRSFLFLPSFLRSRSVPVGLRLVSRLFLDLDSDLEVPLMTFEIFCIVRSPIDSVRVSFGEALACSFAVDEEIFNESKEEAEATFDEFFSDFSSLNELDFFKLEATSLLNAPNSWAKFLTTLDSGLGFKTEVKDEDIEVTVEVIASLMASSPSSSGMVG